MKIYVVNRRITSRPFATEEWMRDGTDGDVICEFGGRSYRLPRGQWYITREAAVKALQEAVDARIAVTQKALDGLRSFNAEASVPE